jgi:hypothetical protein
MSVIPDCTLTTGCFYIHDKNDNSLNIDQISENMKELMKIPIYLDIYCDTKTFPIIEKERNKYGLSHLTKYNVVCLTDLWTYQYEDQVNKNREISWPLRDARSSTHSHLIQCNKFDFVLQTMEKNPFNTTRFGWIDCFIRKNAKKIAEDYTTNMIPYILSNITDKFHIQLLNVNDKKYKLPEFKKEYYLAYAYVVCGCLFTCGKEIGKKILNRGKELFIEATNQGVGHGEEMLYLEILDEFYDDIVRSYGDYGQILNNFIRPTRNFHYIYYMFFNRYYNFGYYKEYCDLAKIIVEEVKSHRVSIEPEMYFDILFRYYISAYYHCNYESKEIAEYIVELCSKNPYYKNEWSKNPEYYKEQLKYLLSPTEFDSL